MKVIIYCDNDDSHYSDSDCRDRHDSYERIDAYYNKNHINRLSSMKSDEHTYIHAYLVSE